MRDRAPVETERLRKPFSPITSCRGIDESGDVFLNDLRSQQNPHDLDAQRAEIVVEVLQARRQNDRLDPDRVRPVDQSRRGALARGIVIACDIEPA